MRDTRVTGVTEDPGHWMARPGDVIGYYADGRPIRLVGGARQQRDDAGVDDHGDSDSDADDTGTDDVDEGTDRDDLDEVLDDVFDDGGDDDDDRDGRSGRRNRSTRRGSRRSRRGRDDDDRDDLADQLSQVNRRIDRLVNAVTHNRRRNDRGRDDRDSRRGDRDRDDPRVTSEPSGPSDADVREARLAFRGYLDDHEGVVVGESARRMAGVLGSATIAGLIREDSDPDEVGRRAARAVARTMADYQRSIQRDVVRRLRRRGLIREDAARDDSAGSGAATTGFGAGQGIRAAQNRARQINQARGRMGNKT